MNRTIAAGGVCLALWLLWSGLTVQYGPDGHWSVDPMLAGFCLGSCALVVWLARKMHFLDAEGHPYHLALRILAYLPWLVKQVVASNMDVAKVILTPKMPVFSHLIRVPASQKTTIGQVIHANTITLTPGTITLDVRDGELLVHALTKSAADPSSSKEIDDRICRVEGEP